MSGLPRLPEWPCCDAAQTEDHLEAEVQKAWVAEAAAN